MSDLTVMYSAKTDEWTTPDELFEELNNEFRFSLDPCSTVDNHKCNKYYTKEENGLSKSWKGETVFCNPPYSDCAKWAFKCWFEWFYFDVTVVLLVPARTDTRWFHQYVNGYAELRFIKGRLRFSNSKNVAPFPSMLAIFKGGAKK